MRDQKKRAKSLAIYWLRKCYDEGLTAGEIVAESAVTKSAVTTVTTKENEGEKRTSPLDPSLEKRAKQEKATLRYVSAGADAVVQKGIDDSVAGLPIPTLEEFLAWCKKAGYDDEVRCRNAYNKALNADWLDNKAKPILNWKAYFQRVMNKNPYKGEYEKLPDDIRAMFDGFWKEYPPRRRNEKDKCAFKFRAILLDGECDPIQKFNKLMEGLAKWKASSDWTRDGGEFVMKPYRWLNNQYWKTPPIAGYVRPRRGVSQTANVLSKEAIGLW